MRQKAMERVRAAPAGGRVFQRHHGSRYYAWELKEGSLRYFEHPLNLPREKKYEGKYLIQTDQVDLTPEDAVAHYKELNEVERGQVCSDFQDGVMRDLPCKRLQCDEIWSFCY